MNNERVSNKYILPSIYGSSKEEERERELVSLIMPKYLSLKSQDKTNTGRRTAILSSNTNGYGRFSRSDKAGFDISAENLQYNIRNSDVIFDATSRDLRSVIQDKDYGNIIVIGHASYHSWQASDKHLSWFDLAQMTNDHLKNGVFINGGCGQITSWNFIPLGLFTVNNPGNLYGKKADYMWSDELLQKNPLKALTPLNPNLRFIPKQ